MGIYPARRQNSYRSRTNEEFPMPNQPAPNLVSWASEIDERHDRCRPHAPPACRSCPATSLSCPTRTSASARRSARSSPPRSDHPGRRRRRHRLRHGRDRDDAHRRRPARHAGRPDAAGRAADPGRRRQGPRRPVRRTARSATLGRPHTDLTPQAGEDGRRAVRHPRLRQPLRRGLPGRARPGLDGAALGLARHRQPARDQAHRRRPRS